MDRSCRQKITKETVVLNDTLNHMYLVDIFRTLHPKAAGYAFFPGAHGKILGIDHMLGHKTSLNKLIRLKSYQPSSTTTMVLK